MDGVVSYAHIFVPLLFPPYLTHNVFGCPLVVIPVLPKRGGGRGCGWENLYRLAAPLEMARRVNDKFITNVNKTSVSGLTSVTLYNASNNAATVDRIILTGSVAGIDLVDAGATVSVALAVLHVRPGGDTGVSTTDGAQMVADDKALMWSGLYRVSTEAAGAGLRLDIDVKGMRKLAIGEHIEFGFRTSTTSLRLAMAVTIFAKLA